MALGALTKASVPKPIMSSKTIRRNVIKPIRFVLITFIKKTYLKAA
tara:strand:- start:441 stop:578 length:138 start_codon:yes stop_codon:yes gene_type:complete